MKETKNKDLVAIKKALAIFLEGWISKKYETRDELVIAKHENDKKLIEAIKLLSED